MKNGSAPQQRMQTQISREIKSVLDAFMSNFGVNWQIKETTHPSFIEGRVGKIIVGGVDVGVVGEVNPLVLEAWKLENPVSAFEVNFQKILESKNKRSLLKEK